MTEKSQQSSVQELQTMLQQKSERSETLEPQSEAEKERLKVAMQSIRARRMLSGSIAL
ncbi:MAG: hypothetical protein ABL890_02280 [Candidatus Peribacteraceae bacterium]